MSEFAITNILQNARDGPSNAFTVIDNEHHQLHDGDHHYIEDFTTMSDTQVYFVKFVTPNTSEKMHLVRDIETNGILEITCWETAVGGMAGGAATTIINSDRNSTKQSSVTIVRGCDSSVSVGKRILHWKVGGAAFKGAVGAAINRRHELILIPNKTYLTKFTAGTTGNITAFRYAWYEHKPNPGPKVMA